MIFSTFLSTPRWGLSAKELRFASMMLFFALLALALPGFSQPQDYHHFADERSLFGIPHALDVLSNMGFLVAGLFGLRALSRRKDDIPAALAWSLETMFWGVMCTASGSAYYHWGPQDSRLVWDRLPMVIAFAGVYGALGATRVSSKAGFFALASALAYGVGSVVFWTRTGNLTPYALMQFGGLAWVAVAWVASKHRALDLPWGALLGFYLAAKFFETFDAQTLHLTMGWVSGHTIKHLLSAMAAASFAWTLWRGASPTLAASEVVPALPQA